MKVIRRNWLFEYKWTDYNGSEYRRAVLEKEVKDLLTFMIDPMDKVLKRLLFGEEYNVYKYFSEYVGPNEPLKSELIVPYVSLIFMPQKSQFIVPCITM